MKTNGPKYFPGALSVRESRLLASRILDAGLAEDTARLIHAAWDNVDAWDKSRPKQEWRKGANGLWSHAA